jgi:hypothetical protein
MKACMYLLLILAMPVSALHGQSKKLVTSVYFKSDKSDLGKEQKRTLDTFAQFLQGKTVRKITVKGHTDSDADSVYNIKLSHKRILAVQDYLQSVGIDAQWFVPGYFGETLPVASNASEDGKQKNRRVDVTLIYDLIPEEKKVEIIEKVVVKKDPCKGDTTIYLPQGTAYTISICDYLKYKDCITITEFLSPSSILNSGLTTETTSNEQLVTGGMFKIGICNDKPLLRPLKLRVPVGRSNRGGGCNDTAGDYNRMSLWTANRNGLWGGSKKIDVTGSEDSGLFYEFVVSSPGSYNLDYKMNNSQNKNMKDVKTSFKARGNIRLVKVVLLFPDPSIYRGKPNSRNKIKMKVRKCPRNGCDSIFVKAVGINEDGDTVVTTRGLNSYKKRIWIGKCRLKRSAGFILGFIPIAAKAIYRKYIFMPDDWRKIKDPKEAL